LLFLFKVSDIYSGTLDQNGEPVQGLSGARVKVQKEEVFSVEHMGSTDSAGKLLS